MLSSEGLSEEGSTSKLMRLLVEFSSLSSVRLRASSSLLAVGQKPLLIPCHVAAVQCICHWAKVKVLAGLCFLLEVPGKNLFPKLFML